MKGEFRQSWQHLKLLRFGLVIVLILGIFFRFFNIDKKLYWRDEMNTSMRIAGYTSQEVIERLYTGRIISSLDIQKYWDINSRGVIDTVNSLAVQEPQHPPLYYVATRFWVQCFGNSVAAIRSLSAIFSILAFPCIYWLCRELFNSPLVAWLAMGLIAISPFHLLYAQEARQYSLWTVTILLSSAALLQAIRVRKKINWGIYAIALAMGLYTFPFTIFVATGHAIYVLAVENLRLSKTLVAYLLASLTAVISFAPWLWLTLANLDTVERTTAWVKDDIGLVSFWLRFFGNISNIFVDFNLFYRSKPFFIAGLCILLCSLTLTLYAVYFIYSNTNSKVWLFIITLMAVTPLALLIPDLLTGGNRSTISRYLIPCYLAIHLSVAYLLAYNIHYASNNNRQNNIWRFLTIVLLSGGILSSAYISQLGFWHIKGYDDRALAKIINQAEKPLVISDENIPGVMTLSYLLDPKAQFQLFLKSNIPNIPANGFSDLFLYRPSKELRLQLEQEQNYNVKDVKNIESKGKLWRLEK